MIAIIDVSGNNLTSISLAVKKSGNEYCLTHDAAIIEQASHVILPGVGHARGGMQALIEHGLDQCLPKLQQPVLGICLGMQLLLDGSDEGDTPCLGIISGQARRFANQKQLPVPHMGWNPLIWRQASDLNQDLPAQPHVYFVHSYALFDSANTVADCDYGENFCAIVQKDNFTGMQFHPEKSGSLGQIVLNRFLQRSSCK